MKFFLPIKTGIIGVAFLFSSLAFADTPPAINSSDNTTFSPAQQKAIQTIVHDYLVSNPQVLIEAAQALQKQQQAQWQNTANKVVPAIAQQLFNSTASPVVGNKNGDVTLVEFFDYQCPHCKETGPQITELMRADKNLRVVYKALPIFGDNSEFAAKAGLAAVKQGKFLALHDALLNAPDRLTQDVVLKLAQTPKVGINVKQLQTDMQNPVITQEIKDNYQLAKKLNLIGTPAFVIAKTNIDPKTQKLTDVKNPTLIPGAVDEATLAQVISQVRSGSE